MRPPHAGAATLFVYVVPLGGGAVAADVNISLSVNGQTVPLTFCSRSCRTADVTLGGGEDVEVTANDGVSINTASFQLPQLPVSDGADLPQPGAGSHARVARLQHRRDARASRSADADALHGGCAGPECDQRQHRLSDGVIWYDALQPHVGRHSRGR